MSFVIETGELAGLIGPKEQAGKTTIFNLVTGVYDVNERRSNLREKHKQA